MDMLTKAMEFLQNGIPVTENQSKLVGAVGRGMVYASEQTGPEDDTPGILSVGEIFEYLGSQLPAGK